MTSALRVTKLDYLTMKSNYYSYLSLLVITLFFGFTGASIITMGFTVAWYMALVATNIFGIQEKNNLDRLYGSVSVSMKEIVLGRYVFVMSHHLVAFIVMLIVFGGFALYRGTALTIADILVGFSLSFFGYSVITGIQMPMFFGMSFSKAKALSMIPFLAMTTLVVVPAVTSSLSGIIGYVMLHSNLLIIGGILAGLIIQSISYQIAVAAYRSRKRG